MLSDDLVKLYDDAKIPSLIRYKLEKEYRISSIDDLIERKEISDFANTSSDVLKLVHVAGYFSERRKSEGDNVQLCPLISESPQFKSWMANIAITKGLFEDGKDYTDDDEDEFQIAVVQYSKRMDEDALRKSLKIDSNDTPWRLNSTLKYVELKKLPREIRLRVPLFKR
jgi:hypothetical protein